MPGIALFWPALCWVLLGPCPGYWGELTNKNKLVSIYSCLYVLKEVSTFGVSLYWNIRFEVTLAGAFREGVGVGIDAENKNSNGAAAWHAVDGELCHHHEVPEAAEGVCDGEAFWSVDEGAPRQEGQKIPVAHRLVSYIYATWYAWCS